MARRIVRNAVLGLLLLVSFAVHAQQYDFKTDARVVAFADVHGAYTDWVRFLQQLRVIGARCGE